MSVRQYIGARYVPKFADPITWSLERSYEPLTIVMYQGSSYTSKIPVPANTPLTDDTYWVLTGNFNGQLEQVMAEIQEVAGTVEDLANDMTSLRKYRNIILIGDSYGTTNGGTAIIGTPLPDVVQTYLGLPNAQFHSRFQNGAGFGNGVFTTEINAVISSLSADEKDDVTDVYFIGGWNDESNRVTEAQFNTGVQACETAVRTNLPNAMLHVALLAHSNYLNKQHILTTRDWYDGLATRGWSCIKNLRYCLLDPSLMDSAGNHPNQTGVNAIAKYLVDAILNGEANVNYQFLIPASDINSAEGMRNNFASVAGTTIIFRVCNGLTSVMFYSNINNSAVIFTDSGEDAPRNVTFNGTQLTFATMENKIAGFYSNLAIPVGVTYLTEDGETISGAANVIITNNQIRIANPFIPSSNWVGTTKSCKGFIMASGYGVVDSFIV